MSNRLKCIIHYENQASYSDIKNLSETNFKRIQEARNKRNGLGGQNNHLEQIKQIPEKIDPEFHGVHLEPCYKRFTNILGIRKFQNESEDNGSSQRQSRRLSTPNPPSSNVWLFPDEFQICGKNRIQIKGVRSVPYRITSFDAAASIKRAAQVKDPSHYCEIENVDLLAKEYKVHSSCYKVFTKKVSVTTNTAVDKEANTSTGSETVPYDRSNFEEVKEYVDDVVLNDKHATSIKVLHDIYGLGKGDSRYRNKLKKRLEVEFGNKISFLKAESNLPEVVIATECLTSSTLYDSSQVIKKAARILREEMNEKFKEIQQPKWPPTAKELQDDRFEPPLKLVTFIENLLTSTDRSSRSKKARRVAKSIAQDIVFTYCRGKVLQPTHFLLGLGLHNLTGSRKIIDIVNKLGHCINYNTVCDIETSQAELVQEEAVTKGILPLKPIDNNLVYTHFWVDNFDIKVDLQVGGGSINTTHLMAFQNGSQGVFAKENISSIERKRNRKLFLEDVNINLAAVDRKKNPPEVFPQTSTVTYDSEFNKKYFFWIFLRKQMSSDQTVPIFKGWNLQLKMNKEVPLKKTIETFLPPINSKVTEFRTIKKYMQYLQELAKQVNMPYVNISLDVGAAMNAYLLTWNEPEMFKNIIIHLGSFHFLKENFQV